VVSDAAAPHPEPRTFREKPVSFVRRSGRMSEAQERAWSELAPQYVIEVPRDRAATSILPDSTIDPVAVWGREAPLIVEIGSGQGHAIVHAATSRPGTDFLAIEVFRAGLARTMLDADRSGARNLRLVEANAPEVLQHLLPPASVDELWIFFPDPWHKKKHTKRRLVADGFAQVAAGALKDGGMLRLATDW
jgi:tRNA (guanine-N7-)-methyltransferase